MNNFGDYRSSGIGFPNIFYFPSAVGSPRQILIEMIVMLGDLSSVRKFWTASHWHAEFFALCVIFLVANLTVGAMPVMFGAYIDRLSVSYEIAGSFATSEIMGLACGGALTIVLMRRRAFSIRMILALSLTISAMAQMATMSTSHLVLIIVARFISGVCTAVIQATAIAWISQQQRPSRPLAIFVSISFLSGAIGSPIFALAIDSVGLLDTFIGYAALLIVCTSVVGLAPADRLASEHASINTSGQIATLDRTRRSILLLVVGVNFVANSGLWVFLERIGQSTSLTPVELANVLGVGMFAAMTGILLLAVAGERAKADHLIVWSNVAMAVSAFLLIDAGRSYHFVLAVIALNIGSALLPAVLFSKLATSDDTGRAGLQCLTAINIGFALGPQIFAWLIPVSGLQIALSASLIVFVLSLPLCLWGSRSG